VCVLADILFVFLLIPQFLDR